MLEIFENYVQGARTTLLYNYGYYMNEDMLADVLKHLWREAHIRAQRMEREYIAAGGDSQ